MSAHKFKFLSATPAIVGSKTGVVEIATGKTHPVTVVQANPNGDIIVEFHESAETPKPRAWAATVAPEVAAAALAAPTSGEQPKK